MTTSLLSHRADNLSRYDIQVLKDYALEAPWAWRKIFEALIEVVEAADGRTPKEIRELTESEEKMRCKLEAMKEAVEVALTCIRETLRTCNASVKTRKQILATLLVLEEAAE